MGFIESINRAFFNLTYNEKASAAYDEQNEKAAGAVEDIKKQIQGYRNQRDKLVSADKASEYFATNSLARITEWENWLEKNGGLASGDYTQKSTEMKTQWESLSGVNKVVQEVERIPAFLDLFLKDKELSIPAAQKKEITQLKQDAETYIKKINNKTPAEILAKRDAYNTQFMDIQKKIPENFEDLKEGYQASDTQITLLQGIDETQFNDYKNRVEQKERSEEDTFKPKRLLSRTWEYFGQGIGMVWTYLFGIIFAMIVANDMIGRAIPYRIFFFVWTFLLFQFSLIPLFPFLLFFYYLFRTFDAINWGNVFSFNPTGPRMDYMKAPVLFALLPIIEGDKNTTIPWYLSILHYDANLYGGLAEKKKIAYEIAAADAVGKKLDPSMFGMDGATFDTILSNLKSAVLGFQKATFTNVLDSLKTTL
jgi:hypothetical protein